MSELRAELLAAFAGERDEHLAEMRRMLALAERHGVAAEGVDVEDVYRRAHSLKGAARAVDLGPVEAVAHRLETLLQALAEGRIDCDAPLLRGIRMALDGIEDGSAALLDSRPAEVGAVVEDLDALLEEYGLEIPVSAFAEMEETLPPTVRSGTLLRVETESLDALLKTSRQLLAEIAGQEAMALQLRQLAGMARPEAPAWGVARRRRAAAVPPDERLAAVARAAEQLVREFEAGSWRLSQLSAGLRGELTRARLLPLQSQFGAYPRMVRELAREAGKEVVVDAQGLDVRADRSILQQSAEAVLHLLRNAVAHGIEPPEERAAAGKEREGRVLLHAEVAGGRLHLRIEDDGRGIDEDALVRRAATAGLLDRDAPPGSEALRALIFQDGLSTARGVSELAGRGLGMGIVRRVVTRLQGEIEIDSRPGRGTRFDLWLPVSLVAQRLVLCECAGQVLALPAPQVRRMEVLQPSDVLMVEGRPMVRLLEREIPLHWLSSLLGFGDGAMEDALAVAAVESGGSAMALAVDGLSATGDWPVAPLPPEWDSDGLIAGTITLDDGSLALVPSVPALFAIAGAAPLPSVPRPKATRPVPTVLVVDDSVTTRTLEKSILEAHGFRVLVAVNGVEALEALGRGGVDLVVSDVEMPQLDGFALLKTMRTDETLRHLPVILVTSRERQEDRERGLHLGADAYIVKQHFNQTDLLETIRQLLP